MSTCRVRTVLCLAIVNAFLLAHANAMVVENTEARPKAEGVVAYNDFSVFDEENFGDSSTTRTTVQTATQGTMSAALSKSTTGSRTTYATSTTTPMLVASTKADITSTRSSTSTTKPSSLFTSVTTTIQTVTPLKTTPLKTIPEPSTDSEPDSPGDFKDLQAESSPAKTSASTSPIVIKQVSSSTATSTARPETSAAIAPMATSKASPKPSTPAATAPSKPSTMADLQADPDDPFRDSNNLSVPTLPPTSSQMAATTKSPQSASGRAAGRAGVIPRTASTPGVRPRGEASITAQERPTPVSSDSATNEPIRERIPLDEGRSRNRLAAAAAGLDTEVEMFTWLMLPLLLIISTVAWIWFCCIK